MMLYHSVFTVRWQICLFWLTLALSGATPPKVEQSETCSLILLLLSLSSSHLTDLYTFCIKCSFSAEIRMKSVCAHITTVTTQRNNLDSQLCCCFDHDCSWLPDRWLISTWNSIFVTDWMTGQPPLDIDYKTCWWHRGRGNAYFRGFTDQPARQWASSQWILNLWVVIGLKMADVRMLWAKDEMNKPQ